MSNSRSWHRGSRAKRSQNRIRRRMRPFSVSTVVDAPRERVFEYLSDIANHAEFCRDHIDEFRLERLDSAGVGAAARYRIRFPFGRVWAESVIAELEPPHVIRLEGQMGRLGRIKTEATYRLTQAGRDMTRVEYTFSAVPGTPADRLKDLLGFRLWLLAKSRGALRRLARSLEEGARSDGAATVAAG
jgi:uncharacterized protein YndB with AHSA1/START domain